MYPQNKVRKFSLTEKKMKLNPETLPNDVKNEFHSSVLTKIFLLELELIDNPSDYIIVIHYSKRNEKNEIQQIGEHINLSHFRTHFILQKDRYLLDTTKIDKFEIPATATSFDIEILTEIKSPFIASLYYQSYNKVDLERLEQAQTK